jgi:hypothetical protein
MHNKLWNLLKGKLLSLQSLFTLNKKDYQYNLRVGQIQLNVKKEWKHVRHNNNGEEKGYEKRMKEPMIFLVIRSKDHMLLDELNMRNINWIAQKIWASVLTLLWGRPYWRKSLPMKQFLSFSIVLFISSAIWFEQGSILVHVTI